MAMTVIDFFGAFPVADFLVRSDGSQMDPKAMLPLEELFVAMVAFPFLIILIAFEILSERKEAALLSFIVHGFYTFHQVWKKNVWDDAIHPNSELITTNFLLVTHIVWAVVSIIIWRLEMAPPAPASSEKAKAC